MNTVASAKHSQKINYSGAQEQPIRLASHRNSVYAGTDPLSSDLLNKADVKADFKVLEATIKTDIAVLKGDLKTDIAVLKGDLKADIAALETRLNKAMIKWCLAGYLATISILSIAFVLSKAL